MWLPRHGRQYGLRPRSCRHFKNASETFAQRVKVRPDGGQHLRGEGRCAFGHGGMDDETRRSRHVTIEHPPLPEARHAAAASTLRGSGASGQLEPRRPRTAHGSADSVGADQEALRNDRRSVIRAGGQASLPYRRGTAALRELPGGVHCVCDARRIAGADARAGKRTVATRRQHNGDVLRTAAARCVRCISRRHRDFDAGPQPPDADSAAREQRGRSLPVRGCAGDGRMW